MVLDGTWRSKPRVWLRYLVQRSIRSNLSVIYSLLDILDRLYIGVLRPLMHTLSRSSSPLSWTQTYYLSNNYTLVRECPKSWGLSDVLSYDSVLMPPRTFVCLSSGVMHFIFTVLTIPSIFRIVSDMLIFNDRIVLLPYRITSVSILKWNL